MTRDTKSGDWRQLKKALCSADFHEAQRIAQGINWDRIKILAVREGDVEATTALSMSAELLDYMGCFDEARERISELADKVIPALRRLQRDALGAPRTMEERRQLKSNI